METVAGRYRVATQANVVNHEIGVVVEADSFFWLEGSMQKSCGG
jgi:hypothetical protein